MANVGVDREQVGRCATLPLSGVERHHLHEAPRADEAPRFGIELRVLGEYDANEERRVDVLLPSFGDDRLCDSARQDGVVGVFPERVGDLLDLDHRRGIGWRGNGLGSRRGCRHYRHWKVEKCARLNELRMLLANRPDSSRREQHGGSDAMKTCFEKSLPAGRGRFGRSTNRHIGKGISGPWLPLFDLEVGHEIMGCTSYAKPGMEIALPPVRHSNYTDYK